MNNNVEAWLLANGAPRRAAPDTVAIATVRHAWIMTPNGRAVICGVLSGLRAGVYDINGVLCGYYNDKQTIVVAQRDTYHWYAYAVAADGLQPLAHPHINWVGQICLGELQYRKPTLADVIGVLARINLNSVYWHPPLTKPLNTDLQQQYEDHVI